MKNEKNLLSQNNFSGIHKAPNFVNNPKIAVIYFPGNNCEEETQRAVLQTGMSCDIVRWNTSEKISEYDGYILCGGWSYEDRIRAGIISSKDKIMEIIKTQAAEGKPVLGICNGCQVLVEAGLIPDTKQKEEIEMALAPNINPFMNGFYCTWVNIKIEGNSIFTKGFEKGEVIKIPIAHAEGRFITKDDSVIKKIQEEKQIIFKYCNPQGEIIEEFPVNPNGSMLNIAGIANKKGNVMGMMPHPERALFYRHYPGFSHKCFDEGQKLTNAYKIFRGMKEYILNRN